MCFCKNVNTQQGMAACVQGLSEEVGDAAKMLGGGKGGRVVFQLNLSLSRLQVVLNYEGAQWEKLSQVQRLAQSVQGKRTTSAKEERLGCAWLRLHPTPP